MGNYMYMYPPSFSRSTASMISPAGRGGVGFLHVR